MTPRKLCLQFSGGRDSLAMLYLLAPHLENIDVVWANSGDAYPELHALVKSVKLWVPHFIELQDGDAAGWRLKHGLNANNWLMCCADNMWGPMQRFVARGGYVVAFRGTKECDPMPKLVLPNQTIDGVTYIMPLWAWTNESVDEYLGPALPEQYRIGHKSSLDCMGCTAKHACGTPTKHLWDEHRANALDTAPANA